MATLIELHRSHAAQAIALLTRADIKPYDHSDWLQYAHGQAYLALGQGTQATAEFQTILQHPSWAPMSSIYPLAHVGAARAAALSGDLPAARKGYEAFFALWKDADPDVPILMDARKEYAKLKSGSQRESPVPGF